ncbi:capsular polysaccharide biosynthesis protein [Acinetobacter sp.]|uniref:capsular polysaccharide biosynthesis protein n=1 Tax=Acinetobacter sp. TaxID=472 RepID=UPI002FDAE3E0
MIVCSRKIKEIFSIEQFVGEKVSVFIPYLVNKCQHFAGWGRKPSFFRAQNLAKKYNASCICLEDGFIRSLGLGKLNVPPLSLVIDRAGIYFNASMCSDLEKLINQSEQVQQNIRARHLIEKILELKVTKYNQYFTPLDVTLFNTQKNILIVDQTFGDQSIQYALASEDSFQQMLEHACSHHPDATIWIKTHPDVIVGKAKGHFPSSLNNNHRIRFISENYNPIELCQMMAEVYVVSSQLGFEALLCGKPVHCFGIPWYAGWGLTQDHITLPDAVLNRRTEPRSLEHLFACAYLKYAKYVSPVSHQLCELEEILDILAPNLQFQQRLVHQNIVVYGFSRWKRQFIADYLGFPSINLRFMQWRKPKENQYVVAWGRKAKTLKQSGYPHVLTVEDGFLRSLGLGAKLIRPFSLVFDDLGIYYDATAPSRLEVLLNQVQLTVEQTKRIQWLIQEIVQQKLTKYNVGEVVPTKLPQIALNKKVLLVIGQVEDDLSVQFGGIDIKTNEALIKEVRANNPEAYIIYKPHPDVETGLRKGKVSQNVMNRHIDHIEAKLSIITLFEYVDEIHTITSLSGFEALLRGLKVYCYGIPFYAGWGLTVDRHHCPRRNRKLMLEELAYTTLIEYPTYNLPHTRKMQIPLVTPEHVLQHMLHLQQVRSMQPIYRGSWLFTRLRQLKNTVLR